MNKNLSVNMEDIFRSESEVAYVYLSNGLSDTDNRDPFRGTGKKVVLSNPLPVKVLLKQVSAYSKSLQLEGLTETQALDIIIKHIDLSVVRAARQIKIKNEIYYTSYDAVGNKFNFIEFAQGFYKVRVYKRNK